MTTLLLVEYLTSLRIVINRSTIIYFQYNNLDELINKSITTRDKDNQIINTLYSDTLDKLSKQELVSFIKLYTLINNIEIEHDYYHRNSNQ